MPTFMGIECSIEVGHNRTKLKEYGARYGDGAVETIIAVPDKRLPFYIHFRNIDYIAPGIAIYIYIDGRLMCNRNRTDMKLPGPGVEPKDYQAEFWVRQKEEKGSDGKFVARDWTFAALNVASADKAPEKDVNFLKNVGTIEVLVMRCKPGGENVPTPKPSFSKVAGDFPEKPPPSPKAAPAGAAKQASTKAPAGKTPSAKVESSIGGMLGIFDGACDYNLDGAQDPREVHARGLHAIAGDARIDNWSDLDPIQAQEGLNSTVGLNSEVQAAQAHTGYYTYGGDPRHQFYPLPGGAPQDGKQEVKGPRDDRSRLDSKDVDSRKMGPVVATVMDSNPKPKMAQDFDGAVFNVWPGHERQNIRGGYYPQIPGYVPVGYNAGLQDDRETIRDSEFGRFYAQGAGQQYVPYQDAPQQKPQAHGHHQGMTRPDNRGQAARQQRGDTMEKRREEGGYHYNPWDNESLPCGARQPAPEPVPAVKKQAKQEKETHAPPNAQYDVRHDVRATLAGYDLNAQQRQVYEKQMQQHQELANAQRMHLTNMPFQNIPQAANPYTGVPYGPMPYAGVPFPMAQHLTQGPQNMGQAKAVLVDGKGWMLVSDEHAPQNPQQKGRHAEAKADGGGSGWMEQGAGHANMGGWQDKPQSKQDKHSWEAENRDRTHGSKTKQDSHGWGDGRLNATRTPSKRGHSHRQSNGAGLDADKQHNDNRPGDSWGAAGQKESSHGWGDKSGTKQDKRSQRNDEWGHNDGGNDKWVNQTKSNDGNAWDQPSQKSNRHRDADKSAPKPASKNASVAGTVSTSHSWAARDADPVGKSKPYWTEVIRETPAKATKKPAEPRQVYEYPAESAPAVPKNCNVDASHGVQMGQGAPYVHDVLRPEYIDKLQKPFAVFRFKYRSKEAVEQIIGRSIDYDIAKVEAEVERARLASLPKELLIEEMLAAQSPAPKATVHTEKTDSNAAVAQNKAHGISGKDWANKSSKANKSANGGHASGGWGDAAAGGGSKKSSGQGNAWNTGGNGAGGGWSTGSKSNQQVWGGGYAQQSKTASYRKSASAKTPEHFDANDKGKQTWDARASGGAAGRWPGASDTAGIW